MKHQDLKNMDEITTQAEEKIKSVTPLTIGIVITLIILGGIYLADKAFTAFNKWRNEVVITRQKIIDIQIHLQWPYKISDRIIPSKPKTSKDGAKNSQISHIPTEFEIVIKQKHGDILWKIYQLETQRGKTDSCRINGNGYGGFGVKYNDEVVCYPTFEKAAERADYWYSENEKIQKSLVATLCKWNGKGDHQVNCVYYQDFISL